MTHDEIAGSIEKYHSTVYRVALGYVKNKHDADDITQDVFFKLYKHSKNFVSDEARKAWLIRVTVNESKNMLKSAWFQRRTELDESLVFPENDDLGVYEYVQMLKPKYRTVIYLHYYEKYTAKEIAEIMRKPQSTIESQLRRSKEQLREIIIKEECYHGI
jgi:RNA polymerase sigma-70 factor (ECF subfamily)